MTERIYEKDGALLKPKEEIIRCKDCKHWDKYKAIDVGCCLRTDYDTATDDYCSKGERKESEEE